jgi:hypothetical protein
MPSRPSGADKKQEPAQNAGSAGESLGGPPVGRADIASRRHRFLDLPFSRLRFCSYVRIAEGRKPFVNSHAETAFF